MLLIEHLKAYNNCFANNLKALIVALACLVLLGCQKTELYSALSEQQANEVQAALVGRGIDASKLNADTDGQWKIQVAPEQFPLAMSVLESVGLPRARTQSMGEVFPKEGFVSSPLEERARYLHALSQELSSTLMQLDGVVSARVHVALPENRSLAPTDTDASVSVVIIHQPNVNLSVYETDIKAIVTDGIEGMNDINRVTVKFFERTSALPASLSETVTTNTPQVNTSAWIASLVALGVLSLALLIGLLWSLKQHQKLKRQFKAQVA